MADNRYKNKVWQGNPIPKKPQILDRPTNHGWAVQGVSDIDGCTIFSLGANATMKADLARPGYWIGNVLQGGGWTPFEITGDLAGITQQIKEWAGIKI